MLNITREFTKLLIVSSGLHIVELLTHGPISKKNSAESLMSLEKLFLKYKLSLFGQIAIYPLKRCPKAKYYPSFSKSVD